MKYKIKDIAQDGFSFSENLAADLIETREEDGLHFISPITVSGKIGVTDNIVYVNAKAAGRLSGTCAYSLDVVEEAFEQSFAFDVEIDRNTQEVDIEDDVRQEIILALPLRLVSPNGQKRAHDELLKKKQFFNLTDDDLNEEAKNKGNDNRPFENLKIEGLTDGN